MINTKRLNLIFIVLFSIFGLYLFHLISEENKKIKLSIENIKFEKDSIELKIAKVKKKIDEIQLSLSNLKNQIPSISPIGDKPLYINSYFGHRKDPFTLSPRFHNGIDIKSKAGDNVYCTANGIIRNIGYSKNSGNFIVIDHLNGYETKYCHLSIILVKKFDYVFLKKIIGKVGNTGRSTGPHLHYEVIKNGKCQNPINYINKLHK